MTRLLNINRTWQLGAVFVIAAGVLFALFMVGLQFYPPKPTVTLTPGQFREALDPYMQHRDSVHKAEQFALQKEIAANVIAGLKLDSAYTHFQTQKDEKVNHTLNATDAELMRAWAERYDR